MTGASYTVPSTNSGGIGGKPNGFTDGVKISPKAPSAYSFMKAKDEAYFVPILANKDIVIDSLHFRGTNNYDNTGNRVSTLTNVYKQGIDEPILSPNVELNKKILFKHKSYIYA